MSGQLIATGLTIVTGAAKHIEVGFIPDVVLMFKPHATVPVMQVWARQKVMAFTSGGTYEIKPGDLIQGNTSKLVRATVKAVNVTSGTWAGGDAAGNLYWQDRDQNGVFAANETLNVIDSSGTVAGGGGIVETNVATVTAAQSELYNFALSGHATTTSSSYAGVTPANGIQPYSGTSVNNSEGFSITATLSTAGDAWIWVALRGTYTV
jgi:hypothetical protein